MSEIWEGVFGECEHGERHRVAEDFVLAAFSRIEWECVREELRR